MFATSTAEVGEQLYTGYRWISCLGPLSFFGVLGICGNFDFDDFGLLHEAGNFAVWKGICAG